MNSLRHFSLGEPLSASPHAIASSLPTLTDLRGYEEGDPRVLNAVRIGYPRFICHPYVRALTNYILKIEALSGQFGVLIPSPEATRDLLKYMGPAATSARVVNGLHLVHCDAEDLTQVQKLQKYMQHVGSGISSRQAEAVLVSLGQVSSIYPEDRCHDAPSTAVKQRLAELYGCSMSDVWLYSSGMSAFYAGFRAVQAVQQRRGRASWLQLGWVYLDSGCVLKTFLNDGETLEHCYHVADTEAIIDKLSVLSETLAGVVVECPTNPMIQVCDLKRITKAVRANGGILMVDPTIASIYNMDVLPYADIVVTSLTKYAAYEGDVMSGSLALNTHSAVYNELKSVLPEFHSPPYSGDLERLAFEMQDAAAVVDQINANARQLANFLRQHPAVRAVYQATDSPHHAEFARSADSGGAVIAIELVGSMARFYDAIAVMKGPSFGTHTTLLSPFMYLAHYDLVTTKEGRAFLKEVGIDPEMIRISVGAEPYQAIEAAFASALEA